MNWALSESQMNAGPDTVLFNIPTNDPHFNGSYWEIEITDPLPPISDDLTYIDGFSQTDFKGNTNFSGPEIRIDGQKCPNGTSGFQIFSANNVICGLAICCFPNSGIELNGALAKENLIYGCSIGFLENWSFILNNYQSWDAIHNYVRSSGINNVNEGRMQSLNSHKNQIGFTAVSPLKTKARMAMSNVSKNYNNELKPFEWQNVDNKSHNPQIDGILVKGGSHDNLIGPGNIIVNNRGNGIHILNDDLQPNKITQNLIFNNGNKAICYKKQLRDSFTPPEILYIDGTTITGISEPDSYIEFFADKEGQSRFFIGSVMADSTGYFEWEGAIPDIPVTMLVIDSEGHSSELSQKYSVAVELIYFSAHLSGPNKVRLSWQTSREGQNLGFWVQKRTRETSYKDVQFIQRNVSAEEKVYEYDDVTVGPDVFYYRLKQIDADRKVHYFSEVRVDLKNLSSEKLIQLCPESTPQAVTHYAVP